MISESDKLLPPTEEVAEMTLIACDWCSHTRQVQLPWNYSYVDRPGDMILGTLVCAECGGKSPFEMREETITFKPGQQLQIPLGDDVPEEVHRFYDEVALCLYARAYRAVVVMARSAVEEALEQRGLQERDLGPRIEAALKAGIIGQQEYNIAHGSRLIGNNAVHTADSVPLGHALPVISAAALIINHLFQ